ncbi:glycerol uptake facilitator protein-like protein [Plenodomus tracheiphilus IPT5]|uniref:Glycerol uptake facilitator protein-like protein n=1 Tax=Plenodomus tracheiphilus IPT5 TaxID=1408161 RepID=A0A6A7BKW3_9PLEO|nr:glycerol uptake facilitator protein-like protein [Plenodomus tracheiphilus IPT5]
MSDSRPTTPNSLTSILAEEPQGDRPLSPNGFSSRQRQQTYSDFRPLQLNQKRSNASTIGKCASNHLGSFRASRPDNERMSTAPTRMPRTESARTSRTNRADRGGVTRDPPQRPEKTEEQKVEIDNEYFRLNPWYNQQKDKPVFGLAAPLPRTVRKGTRWGRGDLPRSMSKVEEDNEDGIDRQDGLEFDHAKSFDDDLEPPDPFQAMTEGRKPSSRRRPTHRSTASYRNSGTHHQGRDRAPVNDHGLDYANDSGQQQHFGMQDGLPPLKELDTHDTTASEKEEAETKDREHKAEQEFYNQYRNPIARLRAQYPQAPAEFLATFVYLFIGICVNLSVATSENSTGSFETQAWGWGFAVMIGIYMAGGVSGAHLSPTISISLSVYRGFPWKMAIVYICMQMLAGLCAGGLAYALYRDAILSVDPGKTLDKTGSALFPKGPQFSIAGGFFNDFVYMAIYVCIAFSLGDDQNSPPGQGMTALIFGFTVFVTMIALGYNTGLGISPARDLGPRLIALWVGYDEAFSTWYWVYGSWGASISGALVGGLMYDLCVFVGGESPVNYRWPQPGDIQWKVREKKKQAKDQIGRIV